MGDTNKKHLEEFEKDYEKIASKGTWDDKDLERMSKLQKIMYYIELRCAMKEGEDYPGSEYIPDAKMSYANGRMRNPMNGRYMSRGSGNYYPPYMDGSRYYDDMGASGSRYYADEKRNALHKLHHMMDMEENPEKKNAFKIAINEIEEHM